MSLKDLNLRPVYNHSNCPDLLTGFYQPLLAEAVRYDRTTYTFTAEGLMAAAAGAAAFIRNGGHIRLICDHSVAPEVLEAVHRGRMSAEAALQQTARPEDLLLTTAAEDLTRRSHLELAYWLAARGIMEVKIALRAGHIFHSKSGIVADVWGNRVAFSGSLNETLAGWQKNWESFHVYTSERGVEYLDNTQAEFETLWNNQAVGLQVIDLPANFRQLLAEQAPAAPPADPSLAAKDYWDNLYDRLAADPNSTPATIPTSLWPHQERFRQQNVFSYPVRKLIADEVGLGKTLQAGIILKTRLNQRKAGRTLVIAPKAAVRQWQSELLLKFAIDAPIIDARGCFYYRGHQEPPASPPWQAPLAIAGHQWLVRHTEEFLATCGEYDLIIVDEAHRARFRDVNVESRRQPNKYLQLLQQLATRTGELLLLTATPMQLNQAELWALLELLEPKGWNATEYRQFYRTDEPDLAEWKFCRDLWRKSGPPEPQDFVLNSDNEEYVARQLAEPGVLDATLTAMRKSAPARRLMSRHTRELLRQYHQRGLLNMPVPERRAEDVVIDMSEAERKLYEGIKPLIQQCYGLSRINQQALGFIATVFRKRLGSSTYAYAQTLRNAAQRRLKVSEDSEDSEDWNTLLDDADLDEITEQDAAALNNAGDVAALLEAADQADRLTGQDSKRKRLAGLIEDLRGEGHSYILLFTQFRDTQKWLSEKLRQEGCANIAELYGQDGELGDRETRLKQFQEQPRGLLLCTETASESLNLQFCSAVINYDIPWNPMTLEQRAGRVDRIGQTRAVVHIVNLFYANTAEHDAYDAVARRFRDIQHNVGEYPPIIAAGISGIIRDEANIEAEVAELIERHEKEFDLNQLNTDWEETPNAPAPSSITMADLEKPLAQPELLPPGWRVREVGPKHWQLTDPQGITRRVTTDPESYRQAQGRLRWWAGPLNR